VFLEEKQKYSKNAVANIKKEITLLEEKKARVDDLVIEGTFDKKTYTRKKGEIEKYLISKKIQLGEYDCTLINPSELIEYGKKFLYNLSSLWKDLDTPEKYNSRICYFQKAYTLIIAVFEPLK
jgi:hypothetical protein